MTPRTLYMLAAFVCAWAFVDVVCWITSEREDAE